MNTELFFIATPAVGEYYFLHPRDIKTEYNSIDDFFSRRGTHGALVLDRENAEALIAEFFTKGIVGAEQFRLINVDDIFGFLREQQQTAVEKQNYKKLNPSQHGQNNPNEFGQRIGTAACR